MSILATEWRSVAWLVAIGAALQGISILAPYCSRLLIDRTYPQKDLPLTHLLLAASVAVILSSVVLRNVQIFFSRMFQARLQLAVVNQLYDRILDLPLGFFNGHPPGAIGSRLQTVRTSLASVTAGLERVASNEGYLLLVPPVLFATDPTLAAVAISVVPLSGYLMHRQAKAMYLNVRAHVEHLSATDGFQTESFVEIRALKALQLESYCRRHFRDLNTHASATQQARYRLTNSYGMAISLLRGIVLSACMWLGWRYLLAGRLTLGEFIACMAYVNYLYSPLQDLIDGLLTAHEGVTTLEAACTELDQPSEASLWRTRRVGPARATGNVPVDIGLHELTFGHNGFPPLFTSLRATFRQGTTTAILGPSGAGKTTLLQLMVGFHTPLSGALTLAGVDIRCLDLQDVRSRIAAVWQDNCLLASSLWDNLTVGESVSKAVVDRVAQICRLDDLLASLPNGYDTPVGERGVLLSGGQRQRIAIARALLRNTPILLFDEATANIDLENETNLLRAITTEFHERLIVFVTHRHTVARFADRMLWCADGTLTEVTTQIKASCLAVSPGESHRDEERPVTIAASAPDVQSAPCAHRA